MIIALENLGKSDKEIRKIIYKVKQEMEEWTEEFAEETHDNFVFI